MSLEITVETDAERSLRKEGARLARGLSKPGNLVSARDLCLDFAIVVITYTLLVQTQYYWPLCVLAFLAVAKAQNSLLLSGHEAIHHSLFSNKRCNDLVGNYVCFAPVGVGFLRARAAHLDHHNYLSTERDEKIDFRLVNPTRSSFLRHIFRPLLGSYAWKGVLRRLGMEPSKRAKTAYAFSPEQARSDTLSIVIASVVLFAALAAIDWRLYVFFWIGPLLTTTAFFHHAKAFLDHALQPGETDEVLYSYRVTWFDRLFFGVQQAHHAEHHLYPHVPYHRLDELTPITSRMREVRYRAGYFAELVSYFRALSSRSQRRRA
jgi:fatty acid desaturase